MATIGRSIFLQHLKKHWKQPRKMASLKVNTAPIKWAQRSDSLYITIALQGKT